MKHRFLLIVCLVFLVCAPAASGQAPTPASSRTEEQQLLKAMLEEIRQLRLELQRANATSQRVLITLERSRIEQTHFDAVGRSLQTVQRQLAEATEAESRLAAELKESEERLSTTDSDAKTILESQIKEMKSRLTTVRREQEEIRNRERELNAELQTSQTKLNELNGQLDAMIRQIPMP